MESLDTVVELARRGDTQAAIHACERRLALAEDDVAAMSLLAEICSATADHARASIWLARIVALRPGDAAAYRRLGGALISLGRAEAATAALRAAIRLEPTSARAHNNLGQALMQLGHGEAAMSEYREALRLEPTHAIAWNNLAIAQERCDRPLDALQSYEKALAAAPHLREAWISRGALLAQLGRCEPALQSFDSALRLGPTEAAVLVQKSLVLLGLERVPEALEAADAALRLDASMAAAYTARGGALRRLGRHADALQCLERAVALDPACVDSWRNLGTLSHEMGDDERAIAACRHALTLDPDSIQSRTRLLARLIPAVPLTEDEMLQARLRFDEYLANLESWLDSRTLSETDALAAAQQQLFYLSYQEVSNRRVLARYRTARAAQLATFAGELTRPARVTGDRADRRLRLGFVSAQVYDHSVFNAILRGWLDGLDRGRFHVALFSLGSKTDGLTGAARNSVDEFLSGPQTVAEWAKCIRDCELDALIYPEIGMHEPTLALASLRLAPRQYAAWGHPETSGLPTIDGFLSAELFEPPGADEHYSERLVRLPHLGVHCRPYAMPGIALDLESLGIPRDGPVFICPGVPFKYRPADDRILVEIARRVGPCSFVFFQHDVAALSRKLQGRIAAAFAAGGLEARDHLRFIPWQPRAAFFALLRQADVYLDTLGFSGFNTLMQAVECHLPCVTYEGRFMRGRLGSGILRRMALPECIAQDRDAYIDLAVRLGENSAHRDTVRQRLRSAAACLYGDSAPIEALSQELFAGHRD